MKRPPGQRAHNKVAIIGRKWLAMGSFNRTDAAERKNAENLDVELGPDKAQAYVVNWEAHRACVGTVEWHVVDGEHPHLYVYDQGPPCFLGSAVKSRHFEEVVMKKHGRKLMLLVLILLCIAVASLLASCPPPLPPHF